MLRITIPACEQWDEEKEEFVYSKEQTLVLEHSLVSISKWEANWCKPFLSSDAKTTEETIDYIRCMTITQNVDPCVYDRLTNSNIDEISRYINAPMTATWFNDGLEAKKTGEQITSEIIYWWMIVLNIPPEYQRWHLNRLLTLIKVCSIKNRPQKKMSGKEVMAHNASLNVERKRLLNTKG